MSPLVQSGIGRLVTAVFWLSERSALARRLLLRKGTEMYVSSAVRAHRRGGVRAWDRFHLPAIRAAGRGRAAYVKRRMGIDPGDASSLRRVHAYEDPLFGVTGHDAEGDRARAVRVETACWVGDQLRAAQCPDVCRVLIHAFETETLRALNPGYELRPLEELLSAGDSRCTFVHTIRRG